MQWWCTCAWWDLLLCSAASPILLALPPGERAVRDVSCTIPSLAFASFFKTGEGRLVGCFWHLYILWGGKKWIPVCVLSQRTGDMEKEARAE